MADLAKRIQVAANISTIAVCVLIGAVVLIRWRGDSTAAHSKRGFTPGMSVVIPGVDFTRSPRTLVLFLRSGCHFCTESAPLYRRLMEKTGSSTVHAVAVLPDQPSVAKAYLSTLGVGDIDQVQAVVPQLVGTPTILLVDRNGLAVGNWVGRLGPDGESDLLKHL